MLQLLPAWHGIPFVSPDACQQGMQVRSCRCAGHNLLFCGAGEGTPNTNFTQAWLAMNQATASFEPRYSGASFLRHANGKENGVSTA